MLRAWRLVVPGLMLLAACTGGGTTTGAQPASTSPATESSLPSKALFRVAKPTPGVTFSLENVQLATGDGVSIGLHPSAAPITLRASASMPLSVCPDDNGDVGTGLSWPFHRFAECLRIPQNAWVQMPSSHTNGWHLGFRVVATRSGAIRSLVVGYQRVDAFFIVVTNPSTMTGMTTTFVPAGKSAAAAIYYGNIQTPPPSTVTLSQAGNVKRKMGACTFPSEATTCFLGLSPGRPATVRVHDAPSARAVVLGLAWP